MGVGIDYGMGNTNIDPETGIRFGVIPIHDVNQAWYDSSETLFGKPHCPHCGNEIPQEVKDNVQSCDQDESNCTCPHCKKVLEESDFYEEESIGNKLDDGKYLATQSSDDTDIFIEKSPFYTLCGFCSPCAPGAGDIMEQEENGIKAYCFGHDFFENDKAPYKVFDVKTNEEVKE
jgi:hypothetical protein